MKSIKEYVICRIDLEDLEGNVNDTIEELLKLQRSIIAMHRNAIEVKGRFIWISNLGPEGAYEIYIRKEVRINKRKAKE